MRVLVRRVWTAAVLLLLLAAALALREGGFEGAWVALVSAACVMAAWEWAGLLGLRGASRNVYLAGCVSLALALELLPPPIFMIAWCFVLGCWAVSLLRIVGVPLPGGAERVFFGMLGLIAIPVAGLILVEFSMIFLGAFLVVVIVADTAAYGVGSRYGRTALVPEISPGKTRAGLGGALLAVAVVSLPMAWGADLPAAALFYFVCLALLAACFSVVGDLTVSLLKRRAKVKDSGRLLPGHGGVLDRVDGMLAAAPVFAMGIWVLQGALRA